jgi:hypothetical protein
MRCWCRGHYSILGGIDVGIVLMVGAIGCASVRQPSDVATDLYTAALQRDAAGGARIAAAGVYDVVRTGLTPLGYNFAGCEADIGEGVRCSYTYDEGCDTGATIMMHMVPTPEGSYRVTTAAVVGIFYTFLRTSNPGGGRMAVALNPRCGTRVTSPLLTSEVYWSVLVPWPYGVPPTTRGDTALAISRLYTNRGATADGVAALGRALALGEDSIRVAATAIVEAGATMGLGLSAVSDSIEREPLSSLLYIWPHGDRTYPRDTAVLRRGIAFLDVADRLSGSVDWNQVYAYGHDIRCACLGALNEMSGIAHYLVGRAYLDRATNEPGCAVWTTAFEALASGSSYLGRIPQYERGDPSDALLAVSAHQLAQRADSSRAVACRST